MNLKQLYDQTPVSLHAGIQVEGSLVRVRSAAGELDLYVIQPENGELWAVPEDRAIVVLRTALTKSQTMISKLQADLTDVKTTVAAIRTKVGA